MNKYTVEIPDKPGVAAREIVTAAAQHWGLNPNEYELDWGGSEFKAARGKAIMFESKPRTSR
jgi:hypothetical protein